MKPTFLDLELGIGECGSKNIGEPGIGIEQFRSWNSDSGIGIEQFRSWNSDSGIRI